MTSSINQPVIFHWICWLRLAIVLDAHAHWPTSSGLALKSEHLLNRYLHLRANKGCEKKLHISIFLKIQFVNLILHTLLTSIDCYNDAKLLSNLSQNLDYESKISWRFRECVEKRSSLPQMATKTLWKCNLFFWTLYCCYCYQHVTARQSRVVLSTVAN